MQIVQCAIRRDNWCLWLNKNSVNQYFDMQIIWHNRMFMDLLLLSTTKQFILHIFERSTVIKIGVERVNQKKHLVEFAGYITLADNRQ